MFFVYYVQLIFNNHILYQEVNYKWLMLKLTNVADVTGTYDSIPTTLTSEAIITDLISGLTIVKTADKQNWATGNLTYTIKITNAATSAFEKPTFTDILDPTLIKLVDNSVKVNDATVAVISKFSSLDLYQEYNGLFFKTPVLIKVGEVNQ